MHDLNSFYYMDKSSFASEIFKFLYSINFESCDVKLDQLEDIGMDNIPTKNFAHFGGLGSNSRLIIILEPIKNNQKPIMISLKFSTVFKMCTDTIKISNYHLIRIKK